MRSLRWHLLLTLWLAVCIVGIGAAAVAYYRVSSEAKELLDKQLQKIATVVAFQAVPHRNPAHAEDSDIEVSVWNAAGKLEYSSTPLISVPRTSALGFSEARFKGEPYRIYAADKAGRHIEIAQPVDVRDDQAEAAAWAALLPTAILLPVLAIVLALVIRALLQPVRDVASAVARRDVLTTTPIDTRKLPREVVPLIDEINRLLERQNAAVQRETEFIADAAHALRTPLAALQLQADVLEGATSEAERSARHEALREGIRRASRVSEQLLSLARVGAGGEGQHEHTALEVTLREVAALYQAALAAAQARLTLQGDPRFEVACDPRSLLLICSNLLDNALRHTPPGGRIEIRSEADADWARVEFSDEGAGLAEDQLERVFQRFYQAPGHSGGSGLGLATVAGLIRRLGGRVWLRNRTDRTGLVATVLLPRGRTQGAAAI
jgi:two-component system, OmpR family, sensor kinase